MSNTDTSDFDTQEAWPSMPQRVIPIYPRSLAQVVGMLSAAITYVTLTRLHVRRASK